MRTQATPCRVDSRIAVSRRWKATGLTGLVLGLLVAQACAQSSSPAAPQPDGSKALTAYTLDASHTRVHWEVDHMGISTTRGRIDQLDGGVWLDAASGKIEVSITADPASVSTGFAAFDKIMRGAQLLSVDAFPKAFFTARDARWEAGKLRELIGEITLRGISRPLRLQALRYDCGFNPLFRREVCGGDFEGRIRRSDFGMTLALPLVADEVRLLIQVEGVRGE